MAERVGMNTGYLGFIERGENVLTLTIILLLADTFGIDAGTLLPTHAWDWRGALHAVRWSGYRQGRFTSRRAAWLCRRIHDHALHRVGGGTCGRRKCRSG